MESAIKKGKKVMKKYVLSVSIFLSVITIIVYFALSTKLTLQVCLVYVALCTSSFLFLMIKYAKYNAEKEEKEQESHEHRN